VSDVNAAHAAYENLRTLVQQHRRAICNKLGASEAMLHTPDAWRERAEEWHDRAVKHALAMDAAATDAELELDRALRAIAYGAKRFNEEGAC